MKKNVVAYLGLDDLKVLSSLLNDRNVCHHEWVIQCVLCGQCNILQLN